MKFATALVIALATTVAAAQAFRIAAIQATGLKRTTVADVIRVSGLTVGQTVSQLDIDAAAGKLVASGLFDSARYSVAVSGGQITITFQVTEISSLVPVVYDNFIWFTDDELTKAVRAEVPAYDGTAADGPVIDSIRLALTNVLRKRSIAGTVTHLPFVNLDGTGRRHIFRVTDPAPKVCATRFPGASPALDVELRKIAQDLLKNDYSRQFLDEFLARTATQPYRHLGYWTAAFGAPIVDAPGAVCAGAAVSMPVTEGEVYRWQAAVFKGNAAVPASTLEPLLGHRAGDVADGARLEMGRLAIKRVYGKVGYLTAGTSFVPELDASAKTATFVFSVDEGPQFTMGKLSVTGASQKDADALTRKWILKPGQVFDSTASDEFRVSREVASIVGSGRLLTIDLAVPKGTHVVDVTLTLKPR